MLYFDDDCKLARHFYFYVRCAFSAKRLMAYRMAFLFQRQPRRRYRYQPFIPGRDAVYFSADYIAISPRPLSMIFATVSAFIQNAGNTRRPSQAKCIALPPQCRQIDAAGGLDLRTDFDARAGCAMKASMPPRGFYIFLCLFIFNGFFQDESTPLIFADAL